MGSVVPSSRYLSQSMLQGLDFDQVQHLIEYGPGTGAFTRHLSERLINVQSRLQLIEKNPVFIDRLTRQYPQAEIHRDSALRVLQQNQDLQGGVDLVVSSLPFTTIAWTETQATLELTHAALRSGGIFRMYMYCHTFPLQKNRRLVNLLKSMFSQVDFWVEVRNFPPACVVHCEK